MGKHPSVKQLKNEQTLKIYAGILCGLMLFVVLARWLCVFCNKTPRKSSAHGPQDLGRRALLLAFRNLERRAGWKWCGRPSLGLVVLVGLYLATNLILSFTNLPTHHSNHLASRFGWMAVANMALCVFFALKNTPLGIAAGVSHVQLNVFHRIVGYTIVFEVLLHAICYAVYYGRKNDWGSLIEPENVEGIPAFGVMLIMLMAIFRRRRYDLFYVSHVAGFIAVVILTGFHRPDWAKKVPIVMAFTGSLWALDVSIRLARIGYNLVNNQATFHPLPDGGTRLLVKKPVVGAVQPGSHCFLWIPRIQFYQTHPFTVVSNGPSGMELVIKSHERFTKALYDFATEKPGCATSVSVNGPYGSLPDIASYDKLVLISGGSGAAFTFGLLNRLRNESVRPKSQSIDFVWAVKRTEHLSWFHEHLDNLMRVGPTVNVSLYVTSEEPIASLDKELGPVSGSGEIRSVLKSMLAERKTENQGYVCETNVSQETLDRGVSGGVESTANFEYKKLNVETVIWEAMQAVQSHQRVLVAACGPKPLIDAVRESADRCRRKTGHRIDVHCEGLGA